MSLKKVHDDQPVEFKFSNENLKQAEKYKKSLMKIKSLYALVFSSKTK